jgi:hypothetical protein
MIYKTISEMRYIKKYLEFISESFISIDSIYQKHYSDIDYDIFIDIIKSDPTTILKDNKIGIYCKWLLNMYRKGKFDINNITKYLGIFDIIKTQISSKDINTLKSVDDLKNIVSDYLDINYDELKLVGNYKEVFHNDRYRIIIPLTLKASKYFGNDTRWCTTHTDSFKEYTKKQSGNITPYDLYIIYNNHDMNDRYQFIFRGRQFSDISDNPIDIRNFLDENKDIYNFFNSHFDIERYINGSVNLEWHTNTLEGAPENTTGDFDCSDLTVVSLKGSPKHVEGDYNISFNSLKNLEYGAEIVEGDYLCNNNLLETFDYLPELVEGDFICENNFLTLEDIEKLHSLNIVKGTIYSDHGIFEYKI